MLRPRLLACVLLALCLAVGSTAQTGKGTDPALVQQIDSIIDGEPGLKGGIQGIVIQSLADGTTWYERSADTLLLPASNQKLLTSAAVLAALGPDWRYTTRLVAAGRRTPDGTLRGSLYLVGAGDPLLERADLDKMAAEVARAGLRRVTGRVFGDDSRFDSQRYGDGWCWDDMPFYYSAQVSALNVDENLVLVRADPVATAGKPVRVTVTPDTGYVKVVDRATTVPKGGKSVLYIGRELGKDRVTVDGTLAIGVADADHRPAPITVESPARYAACLLTDALRRHGVSVGSEPRAGKAPAAGAWELARHLSPPMSEVLKRLNKPSDNLVAECLLKTLAAEKDPSHVGSWPAGRDLASKWLASLGLDPAGIDMTDGSGLSRQNFVTPRNMAKLLAAMHAHPYAHAYVDSLPIAGVDGSLRGRMKGTPAENNCHAKTGYVSSVSSLSGYVTTKDGVPLAFSMLMNNHKARNVVPVGVQNRIVILLASWQKAAH